MRLFATATAAALAACLAGTAVAEAREDGGRCSPKHLAGSWAATLQVVLGDEGVVDAYCTLVVGRGGELASESSCLVGDLASEPFPVTGELSTTRSCAVSGAFDVDGIEIEVKGQVSKDRDMFMGVVSGEGWFKPVDAIRTGKSRGKRPRKH